MGYTEKIWLKHYEKNVPATLEYFKMPLHALLEQSAKKYTDNRALSYLGNNISYAKLNKLANQAANSLLQIGIHKGDRVAIYLANTPQFIIALYGISKIGAIAVPINTAHKGEEVAFQLDDSGSILLIMDPQFRNVITELQPGINRVKHICVTVLVSQMHLLKSFSHVLSRF